MESERSLRPVVAVVGPTAAGKSELSLRLAAALDGEVVNADSMQLYRGMDIGTGKLSVAERGGVPHHLLDIWDVTETASVSEYQRLARAVIEDIQRRGRVPILVGGSGLYVRAAIDNLQFPGTDAVVRERLENELAVLGPAVLHARLAAADPAAGTAILPGNGRRIVRALEVIELSGQPFSATLPDFQSVLPAVQIGLELPRPELDQRIAARVRQMWQAGLVDEVRRLPARASPGRSPARASRGPACERAGRPARRSATRRCSASSTASGRRPRRRTRPCARRGGSPAGRNPGSGGTRESGGCQRSSRCRRGSHWRSSTSPLRPLTSIRACVMPKVTAPGTISSSFPTSTTGWNSALRSSAGCATGTPGSAPTGYCGS